MMRSGWWLMLSGGLAVGVGSAVLALTAHSAMASSLALLPPMTFATLAILSLYRKSMPFPFGVPISTQCPPSGSEPAVTGSGGGSSPTAGVSAILPVITFVALPVVSVADGRPVAATIVEPCFRSPDQRIIPAGAIDWAAVPAPMLARLDQTLLERAIAFAELRGDADHAQTVIVSVAASSLRDRGLVNRLAQFLDHASADRPRLLVLARGGAEDLDSLLQLPRPWRDSLGLHLETALGDEGALSRCLNAGLGCLEINVGLLAGCPPETDLTARLMSRVAASNVPVVVSGVIDDGLLRHLRRYPALFARGPLPGSEPAVAA